jgi:hypothetical protein
VVKYTTSSANEEFNTVSQVSNLVINWDTTVHCCHLVLIFSVLKTSEDIRNLKCELSCGCKNYCLDSARA